MGEQRRHVLLAVGYALGVPVVHLLFTVRYGGLVASYLTEGGTFLLTALVLAIVTWIVVSLVLIETRVFAPIAIVLPLFGLLFAQLAYTGGNDPHPATPVLAFVYTVGLLGGIGLRNLLRRRGERGDRVAGPIARRKRAIVAAGALLALGGAVASAARVPTTSIDGMEPTHEHLSVYLAADVESDPANLRLVLETPTETFDEWLPRSAFAGGSATGTVRMAPPSAAPSVGDYELRVETVWTRTAATASFAVEEGPELEVTGIGVSRERTEFAVENRGDGSAPVWDHDLRIDGVSHRIVHETDVVHPGDSTTVAGPIGTHAAETGRWEPEVLEEGEHTVAFRVESRDQTLLEHETTVEITAG